MQFYRTKYQKRIRGALRVQNEINEWNVVFATAVGY